MEVTYLLLFLKRNQPVSEIGARNHDLSRNCGAIETTRLPYGLYPVVYLSSILPVKREGTCVCKGEEMVDDHIICIICFKTWKANGTLL